MLIHTEQPNDQWFERREVKRFVPVSFRNYVENLLWTLDMFFPSDDHVSQVNIIFLSGANKINRNFR